MKYKHKITGDIAELKSESGYQLNRNTIGLIPKDYIENSNDWEKVVVEKDYEILCYSRAFNRYSHSLTKRDESWDIHSVKRLSDGVIFSIGDKIEKNNEIIKGFYIDESGLKCIYSTTSSHDSSDYLKNIGKIKEKLFTTEDGVDIHLNDTFYSVTNHYTEDCEAFELQTTKKAKKHHIDFGNYEHTKHFSTKEKAEEYIIMNKPCLSIKDFKKIFTNARTSIIEPLKELVKSKLNG